jgi:hypothetical protein
MRFNPISLAFSLVEEGGERVPSELLLVVFSRHGPSGESVAPPSSSQARRAVAPVAPGPVSIPADTADDPVTTGREHAYAE